MNKYAAEKIAQDYYAIGAQLALTKQANFAKGFHKAHNALIGALGGIGTAGLTAPHIRGLLSKSDMLGKSLTKGDKVTELKKLLGEHTSDLNALRDAKSFAFVNHSSTPEAAQQAIEKVTQEPADAGTLATADQIINMLPGALGIGAGLGVGTGLYKGLGKLDKKIKLY